MIAQLILCMVLIGRGSTGREAVGFLSYKLWRALCLEDNTTEVVEPHYLISNHTPIPEDWKSSGATETRRRLLLKEK